MTSKLEKKHLPSVSVLLQLYSFNVTLKHLEENLVDDLPKSLKGTKEAVNTLIEVFKKESDMAASEVIIR